MNGIRGLSVLIYESDPAAGKERKPSPPTRRAVPDCAKRVFINDSSMRRREATLQLPIQLCFGSNRFETTSGRKTPRSTRRTANKGLFCVEGFCPSCFVPVMAARW